MARFERRDAVLAAGVAMFMIGLIPFTGAALAVLVACGMFFGIKAYVGRRRREIEREVGEGACLECGSAVRGGRCPVCDG
ncbi:MAG: hypothetical protein MPI95_05110 [Nitrosopumilus sp.]|nr:hypothetical protein [Nitrosopumilus sp.]CAI9831243.1 conserved hypothetical protein [Nitrosopumilaceae archaeon]MDA7940729.1 hypothetical protein [Nitrosopumilus sp.]MDA7942937.1 hypothetical protein [Nitrosopumilus sp.]MDA7944652.1 hypothetical protein [Nitrosopumilus sp.]